MMNPFVLLQRESKLKDHVQSLRDMEDVLEELLAWLGGLERTLMDLEAEELPEEPELIEGLIKDHTEFMENTAKRQADVDHVCKPRQVQAANPTKQTNSLARKGSKPKTGFG
jgi:dystonin